MFLCFHLHFFRLYPIQFFHSVVNSSAHHTHLQLIRIFIIDSAYWAVQENINAIRAAAGLSPLAMDGGLSAAADARCESFVAGGAFDHSGMTTRSEICAAGPIGSASSVCSYWQNSPAHYANITNASFTSMGVGCWFCSTAEGQYTYWTVTFN